VRKKVLQHWAQSEPSNEADTAVFNHYVEITDTDWFWTGFTFDLVTKKVVSLAYQVSISPTFYEQLLRQNPSAKKLQAQIVST
jgi:hypothetical protein